MSRGAAKESFAAPRLVRQPNKVHGLQPWLHSYAAPRLTKPGEARPIRKVLRILVVEDEVKVAKALKEGLEGERYEAVVAHTGEDAFFRINTEQFDVIVLDVMLPGR